MSSTVGCSKGALNAGTDEVSRPNPKPAISVAIAALAFSWLPALPAMANCENLLQNNVYQCEVKAADGEPAFSDCFRFENPGAQSLAFDLTSDSLTEAQSTGDAYDEFKGVLACDCGANGSFALPRFGESNLFQCVSTPVAGLGLAFHSLVRNRGNTIVGQGVNQFGLSFFFECDRVESCELASPSAGAASSESDPTETAWYATGWSSKGAR